MAMMQYVHTNVGYFERESGDFYKNKAMVLKAKYDQIQQKLELKEEQLYKRFGADDYEGFRKRLVELHEEIGPYLERCSGDNIIKYIADIRSQQETQVIDKELDITFNTDNLNGSLDKIFTAFDEIVKENPALRYSVVGNKTIRLTPDLRFIKAIITEGLEDKKHRFNYISKSDTALRKYLFQMGERLSENGEKLLDVITISDSSGGSSKEKLQKYLVKWRPFPWGYEASEVRKILQEGSKEEKQKVTDALKLIEKRVKERVGYDSAPESFRRAFDITIKDKLSITNGKLESSENAYIMFMGGGNWENNLMGIFGEFATAILFNYLSSKGVDKTLIAKITGGEHNEAVSQQKKIDVDVLGTYGIQVKNYAEVSSRMKNIAVNQNPRLFGQYLDEGSANKLEYFLTNYFFNPLINQHFRDDFKEIEKYLASEFQAELLRLDLGGEDQIIMYNVGMKYFIPASAIYAHFFEQIKSTIDFEIKGPAPVKNVRQSKYSKKYVTNGQTEGPNVYWKISEVIDNKPYYVPTQENVDLYEDYAKRLITFKVHVKNFKFEKYKIN